MSLFARGLSAALFASALICLPSQAMSETIFGALAKAYSNNASLNSARAGVRVTDEGVAIAKSGWRPIISGTGSIDVAHQQGTTLTAGSFGVAIQQSLFDGFQTKNNVRAARAQVEAAQESLRNTEQNILFNAAAAYMNVIRDRQIAALTEQNLDSVLEQVRAANSRLEVGEGTRTDVAQAEASRQAAIAQLSAARAQVTASEAEYRQIVGDDPGTLRTPSPLSKLLPASLDAAIAIAAAEHPAIQATQHLVDAADFQVKSAEGTLLPQVSASAGLSHDFSNGGRAGAFGTSSSGFDSDDSARIGLTLTVPIYQGGLASAQVRQAKESLGQARIEIDVTRDQVRQAISSAWGQYQAARESAQANRALVSAAKLALSGVEEERKVGQRTTLDVLNAQADVLNAQINLVSAERDVIVASYAIVQSIGRLSASRLGLQVATYHPEEHYNAVKDKWYGLRTPDGR